MSTQRRRSAIRNARVAEDAVQEQEVDVVDFKMVTFSLGGKDYGIDIMKVGEIAKFAGFTYVPNCPAYVRGVYNLRGDIISVIDLRRFFSIPVPEETAVHPSNGLILRLPQGVIGVVVDSIDKVAGISSATIQPPHPIFADINLKYISGVVEYSNRLYIILDVDRIFSGDASQRQQSVVRDEPASIQRDASSVEPERSDSDREPAEADGNDVRFAAESLAALTAFHSTDLNAAWVARRYEEWSEQRRQSGREKVVRTVADAEEFLQAFYSPYTGEFWSEEYSARLRRLLSPDARSFTVWNPGCGKGHESYSIAATLRRANQQARIKIWGSDRDLLNIATAPNLIVTERELPSYLRSFAVKGTQGFSIGKELKDLIIFEYHDILHTNAVPDIDLIVVRDVLSFIGPDDQDRILAEFSDRLVDGGLLVLGSNEQLPDSRGWVQVAEGPLNAFRKERASVGARKPL